MFISPAIDPSGASTRFRIASALDAAGFARFVNQVVGEGLWDGSTVCVDVDAALVGDEGTRTILDFAVGRLARLNVRT